MLKLFAATLALATASTASAETYAIQAGRLIVDAALPARGASTVIVENGRITRIEGACLFAGIVVYTVWTVRKSRQEQAAVKAEYKDEFDDPPLLGGGLGWQLAFVVGGLALLVLGANWLVCLERNRGRTAVRAFRDWLVAEAQADRPTAG